MKSNKLFDSVQVQNPSTNVFDLSHDVKQSMDMGYLVPFCVMDVLPGDHITLGSEALIRFAPMVAPPMHRIRASFHYFFVPNRLTWPGWENFITNTDDGAGIPAVPYLLMDDALYHTSMLPDYMGIPEPPYPTTYPEQVSALPFAAYLMIYNEYYRDQNLISEVGFELTDGDNSSNPELCVLKKSAWMHDYFTSCLPFAQKGQAVDLPLGKVTLADFADWDALPHFQDGSGNTAAGAITQTATPQIFSAGLGGQAYDPEGSLEVGATTVNDLRRAIKLQEWLEKNARGGTRYTENINIHFGVKSPDARLQRPEYITGTVSNVTISEVLNTAGGDTPQGTMAGHGISYDSGKYGSYFAQEHGYIIGIMRVMPDTAYQQGIPRHWLRKSNTDYAWPSFAHLGEQEVFLKELYAYSQFGSSTFGYLPRYAEYKFIQSRVSGEFRDSLDFWHMGRIFGSAPALNQLFIEANPTNRIFAVETGVQHLYVHVYNKIKARRKLPFFGTSSF